MLSSRAIHIIAAAGGFEGSIDDWQEAWRPLSAECGPITFDVFSSMLDDTSEEGAFLSDSCIRLIHELLSLPIEVLLSPVQNFQRRGGQPIWLEHCANMSTVTFDPRRHGRHSL